MKKKYRTILIASAIIIISTIFGTLTFEKKDFDIKFAVENEYIDILNVKEVHMKGYLISFPLNKYYVKGNITIGDVNFLIKKYRHINTITYGSEKIRLYDMDFQTEADEQTSDGHRMLYGNVRIHGSITHDTIDSIYIILNDYPEIYKSTSFEAYPIN